jgi:hypothetical protein
MRRPNDPTTEPPGGRALERLKEFERQRAPKGAPGTQDEETQTRTPSPKESDQNSEDPKSES